jgi:hypothetical protein
MASLKERSTCNTNEPAIVLKAAATSALSDIGADAVRRADHLLPDAEFRERLPLECQVPDLSAIFSAC